MLKVIVFDFDGVIIESADIKTEAFRKLFKEYPKHVDAIVEYHKKNAGVSRYEKFPYIYENILKQPIDERKMAELGKHFSSLVLEEIKGCPFVPGALKFFQKYSETMKLFIASSTPDEEVRYLAKERGLQKYFHGVYGAPSKKSEITLKIIKEEKANKKEVLFVGDTTADYTEAKKAQVQFIGRVTNLTNSQFPDDVKIIKDFDELSKIVDELTN